MSLSTTPQRTSDEKLTPGCILIVDDLAANLRLLSGILKVEGFEVITAESGVEALAKLEQTTPDVVLLDVMMPGMDGFEVCSQIRQNPATAQLPVVMVTALQETQDRVRAIEAGADDFLTKPVEELEVVARVRSLVSTKRNRDELQQAYQDLQEAEQMRDSLAAMVVHDLRTPLTTMMASVYLLQSGQVGPLDELQQEVTDMCLRSGQHLLTLVSQLLDISKLESGEMQLQMENVAVLELIQEALTQVDAQARSSKTSIEVLTEPDLSDVYGDTDLIRRVLINLLGNALKFTRPGSNVWVTAHLQQRPTGPEMLFSVRDDGDGIPLDEQEYIFDKFAQARNHKGERRTSTGLGLTFCKLAVEAHGGRIWVESTVNEGSTFFFAIPMQPADSVETLENSTN